MMESIARILVASTDLLEAEGRAFKRQAGRLFIGLGIGIVAFALILVGLGFVIYGLFAWLAQYLQPHGAAMVFGVVVLVAAYFALRSARRLFG